MLNLVAQSEGRAQIFFFLKKRAVDESLEGENKRGCTKIHNGSYIV
jgi:hypothetical protein